MTKEELDMIVKWEDGQINEVELVKLFQGLVDSGDAFTFGYGKQAQKMINAGTVKQRKDKR